MLRQQTALRTATMRVNVNSIYTFAALNIQYAGGPPTRRHDDAVKTFSPPSRRGVK